MDSFHPIANMLVYDVSISHYLAGHAKSANHHGDDANKIGHAMTGKGPPES